MDKKVYPGQSISSLLADLEADRLYRGTDYGKLPANIKGCYSIAIKDKEDHVIKFTWRQYWVYNHLNKIGCEDLANALRLFWNGLPPDYPS